MVRSKGKLPKKSTSRPAHQHSSSDEGVNPYLPAPAEKKTMKKSRRDAPSTSHSYSDITGSNAKTKPNQNPKETTKDSKSIFLCLVYVICY